MGVLIIPVIAPLKLFDLINDKLLYIIFWLVKINGNNNNHLTSFKSKIVGFELNIFV